jgi:protein-L-isoaspartate(D-aspartate) O-methyltransferase
MRPVNGRQEHGYHTIRGRIQKPKTDLLAGQGSVTEDAHLAARAEMVERQLRQRGIRDERVLGAMAAVPRERFVAPQDQPAAYHDRAMPIGHGQTISQPYMVALMTESLHLRGPECVLEIGTGSGYQAAVLAEVCSHVYTVERLGLLSQRARRTLCDELGYANISFRVGDGTLGWADQAPFDRVIVTAGAPARPESLLRQIAPGGEAVVPVGPRYTQTLMHYRKDAGGDVREKQVCDCVFVQLIGQEGW